MIWRFASYYTGGTCACIWLASGLHLADNYDGENVADDDAAATDHEDWDDDNHFAVVVA